MMRERDDRIMDTHRYCRECGIHSVSCPCAPILAGDHALVCAHPDHDPARVLTVDALTAQGVVKTRTCQPITAQAVSRPAYLAVPDRSGVTEGPSTREVA